MAQAQETLTRRRILAVLPEWLQTQLTTLARELGGELYLAGGAARDLLLGKTPEDIDLTVAGGASLWAGKLATLSGGAYVPLGRDEDAARVVSRRTTIDFSSFRQGATTIDEDLVRRDLTLNALAVRLDPLLLDPQALDAAVPLIDPTGGREDLARGVIRAASAESFTSDPLRLLRVFRFAATLGFTFDAATLALVERQAELLSRPAPERVAHEMDLIMASGNGHAAVCAMADAGLLWIVVPELIAGVGLDQPKSHHLDVFRHNLEALRWMEQITAAPAVGFPKTATVLPPIAPAKVSADACTGPPCSTIWASRPPVSCGRTRVPASPFTTMTGLGPRCSAGLPCGCGGATTTGSGWPI